MQIPCREVFLGDALICPDIAADVRASLERKKNLPGEARNIENYLYKLREQHGGNVVNVEDATVTYDNSKRKVTVAINNCWHDSTGKTYVMVVGLEDWLNFGKPFTNETRKAQAPDDPWQGYARVKNISKTW